LVGLCPGRVAEAAAAAPYDTATEGAWMQGASSTRLSRKRRSCSTGCGRCSGEDGSAGVAFRAPLGPAPSPRGPTTESKKKKKKQKKKKNKKKKKKKSNF
jgi:hypothetical protein